MNYKQIIQELISNVEKHIWNASSSKTCFSTMYNGNGIIICYYYNGSPESVAFYFLNDMGYRTTKGFDAYESSDSERFNLIKELHAKLCVKHGLRVA